jgi:hypothetical protein
VGDRDPLQVVRDAVAARAAETAAHHRGASQYAHISRVGLSVEAHPFLVEAARKRGISISGYIRRATMALVAMDLGLQATDLFEKDIAITPIGRRGAPPSRDIDGALYGRWEVQPGDSRADPGRESDPA